MKQYKGYYIDHVTFDKESEIDEFIKNETKRKYEMLCKMFSNNPSVELSAIMKPVMEKLHDFGLSYDEIEQIEINAVA